MISGWFEARKGLFIFLGVVYILLALFVVSAFPKESVNYRKSLYLETEEGRALVSNYIATNNVSEEEAINNVKNELDVPIDELPEDDRKSGLFIKVIVNEVQDVKGNLHAIISTGGEYLKALKTYSEVYGFLAFLLLMFYKSEREYEGVEHGSASWSTKKDAYSVLSKNDGMILAKDYCMPMLPRPPSGKNGNILVIGGSGSGKSASFAIPNAMQMLGSYCFTDPKGEIYDRTAGLLKKNGYKIYVINLADPKYSDGYNPLAHIRNTMDVDIITKIISEKDNKAGSKSSDPFWDQTSEALLKACIYYILFNRPKVEHSLASCAALVRFGAENEGEDLMEIFKSLDFDNPARRQFDTIRLGSEKTFANILVSLAAKLSAFDSQDIAELTACNSLEFKQLVQEKSVVYFITPESHGTYDFLMNIFFSQMFQRLYEFGDQNGGELPIPMFLILDEFANIGRIPNFERILSTCRSKRLHISIILQSLDQIEEIYDEKMAQIIMANCSTQLFLGTNAQKTLETISKLLGEKTISHDSNSLSTDKDNSTSGHSYSEQIMARALMTPDELRRMSADDCLIFVQAMKPIKAKKYWYYKKRASGVGGPHPLYDEAKNLEISHLTLGNQIRGEFVISKPTEWNSSKNGLFDDIWGSSSNTKKDAPKVYEESADTTSKSNNSNNSSSNITNVNNNNEDMDYDLQAELEKKFDELFGPPKNKKSNN